MLETPTFIYLAVEVSSDGTRVCVVVIVVVKVLLQMMMMMMMMTDSKLMLEAYYSECYRVVNFQLIDKALAMVSIAQPPAEPLK